MPFRIFLDPHPEDDTKKLICRGPIGVLVVHAKLILVRNFAGPDLELINIDNTSIQGGAADRLRKRDSRLEDSGVTSGEFTDHEPAASGSGGLRQNTAGTDISIKCSNTFSLFLDNCTQRHQPARSY